MKILAGTALVGFIFTGSAVSAFADAVEQTVKLTMQNSKCTADIGGGKRVIYTTKDVLVFSFSNECRKDQVVLVCAERKPGTNTTHPEPWAECEGLPLSQPALIGKEFTLKTKPANAVCSVKWPDSAGSFLDEEFVVYVDTADPGSHPTCPPKVSPFMQFWEWFSSVLGQKKRLAPEIALEVDP